MERKLEEMEIKHKNIEQKLSLQDSKIEQTENEVKKLEKKVIINNKNINLL